MNSLCNMATSEVNSVTVLTTSGRGFTPEEIADRALDKIIYVGANAHPLLREQAEAYRESIRNILVFYMQEAIRSHNTTLANKFHQAGHPEMVPILDA